MLAVGDSVLNVVVVVGMQRLLRRMRQLQLREGGGAAGRLYQPSVDFAWRLQVIVRLCKLLPCARMHNSKLLSSANERTPLQTSIFTTVV